MVELGSTQSLAAIFRLPGEPVPDDGPDKVTSVRLSQALLKFLDGYAVHHREEFPDGRSGIIRAALLHFFISRAGGVQTDDVDQALAVVTRFIREQRSSAA